MAKKLFLLVAAVLLVAAFYFPVFSKAQQNNETIFYSQDFESGQAPDWSLEPGWEVSTQEGGHVLQGIGHVWAHLKLGEWTDYFLRFRLKLNQEQSAVHANIRMNGAARYFIGFNIGETYLSRQDVDQTFHENLAKAISPGPGWHTVEITANGGQITVSVDGKIVISYVDPTPLKEGGVAFESLAMQSVWIDEVVVGQKTQAGVESPSTDAAATPTGAAQAAPTLPGTALKWQYMGGPLGGLGYDVRMRLDNPDVMYVTDARAGAFRSKDGGKTWQAINNGITTRIGETGELIPVFCLTIDPHNPDIIWAGTQTQTGLFKSLDGGDSWKKMDNGIEGQSLTLRGITVDPRSSDIVYVAGEISSWEWAGKVMNGHEFDLTKGVVYKTTNGGKSWQKIWRGDNLARYIWIDPRNPDVLYVSTGIFDREAANSDYAQSKAGGVGVIKSMDGGKTWQPANNGLGNLYVGSLFMHPQNPDVLLAGVGSVTYTQGSGIYITTDGGNSWKKVQDTYSITSVEFSTSNPNIAYAGSVNSFFRSQDGGFSWRLLNSPQIPMWGPSGTAVGTPIDFQVDPRNPDRLFVNSYGGGNFLSEDGGTTWQSASNGYSGSMVRDIVIDPRGAAGVYAASRSGLFFSRDGGQQWTGIATGDYQMLDWHAVAVNPSDPSQLVSELTCPRVLVFSTNGGKSWVQALIANNNIAFRTIEFAPTNAKIVYAGSMGYYSCGGFQYDLPAQGIYVSQDGGRSWKEANDVNTKDAALFELAVHPQDPQTVFAATAKHGLLKTTDGGKSWQAVAPNLFRGQSATAIQFSPHDANLLLAGRYQGGILRSQDGGATWKIAASGVNPESTIVEIVFDATNPVVVYAADIFSGVFRSLDAGLTWKAINAGLELRAVNALTLSGDGLHLYAGTEGRGVFRLDLNGQPPEPLPILPTPTPTLLPTPAQTSLPTSMPASQATDIPPTVAQTAPMSAPTSEPNATTNQKPGIPCLSNFFVVLLLFLGSLGFNRWLQKRNSSAW
jgi:photosystem II stability/assembly factor-like uncharacterized protein